MTDQLYLPGMEHPNGYHSFIERLIYSDIDLFQLDMFYKREFSNVKKVSKVQCMHSDLVANWKCTCQECILQKQGIDTVLILKSGKKVYFDEKKRSKDYGDILLEEYSKFEERKEGWLGENKKTDYISYIVQPTKKVYFLPFLLLQRAWRNHYLEWLEQYGRVFAQNYSYQTSNIPIPINVLFDALFEYGQQNYSNDNKLDITPTEQLIKKFHKSGSNLLEIQTKLKKILHIKFDPVEILNAISK